MDIGKKRGREDSSEKSLRKVFLVETPDSDDGPLECPNLKKKQQNQEDFGESRSDN